MWLMTPFQYGFPCKYCIRFNKSCCHSCDRPQFCEHKYSDPNVIDCIHYANHHLIYSLLNFKSLSNAYPSKQEEITFLTLPGQKLIRKHYIYTNKQLFSKAFLLSINMFINRISKNSDTVEDLADIVTQFLRLISTMRQKQIDWIFTDSRSAIYKSMTWLLQINPTQLGTYQRTFFVEIMSMLQHTLTEHCEAPTVMIRKWMRLSAQFPNRHILSKPLTEMQDHQKLKCGNMICRKKYSEDVYGIELPDDSFPKPKYVKQWNNKKAKKRWKICKGCKTTYYCSRRCQKVSWNRGYHKYQCLILQNMTNLIL